ncbi:MAG: DNA adenine methylase [Verrucomicrobiae bacterium]|nr:DNA adenine methylase [Verrucomicrobiae bacterium]
MRSPFRYPGGKTWLIPVIREWLRGMQPPSVFVEPFAGGGIISMTVAAEQMAPRVVMSEIEKGVAALWKVVLEDDAKKIVERIRRFNISRESVLEALEKKPANRVDLAFQTLLRNRTQRGGIVASGASLMRNGENGRGVASRWYPQTLIRRIEEIHAMAGRIEFHERDAYEVIAEHLTNRTAAFFVDPPYTCGGKNAGRRLYTHNQVDHQRLFQLLARASGMVLCTYSDSPEVRWLSERYGFTVHEVAMKNTHHTAMKELVLLRNGFNEDRN